MSQSAAGNHGRPTNHVPPPPVRRDSSLARASAHTPSLAEEPATANLAEAPVAVHHDRKIHHAAAPEDTEENVALGPARPIAFRQGGRVHLPPAMKGSHEILIHQNLMADQDGLSRVQDDADLLRLRAAHELVPLPTSASLAVDERLPQNRRYTRPWVAAFLVTLARAHAARFGGVLQVNSAVRTVEFQMRLIRTNGNAAPADGDIASPHLTGQAIDIAKHGLSQAEIGWLREYLLPLVAAGKIDVEEEFQQLCFHISVYRSYAPASAEPRQKPAPVVRVPVVLAEAEVLP